MAKDVTVTFEDGTTHDYVGIPDTVSPKDVTERAVKDSNKKVVNITLLATQPEVIEPSQAKETSIIPEAGRVADKAIRGGLLAIPELIGIAAKYTRKAGEGAARLFGAEEKDNAKPSVLEVLPEYLKAVSGGEIKQPETTTGKYLGAAGQGIVSSLAPGSQANMLRSAVTGATSGLGAEAAVHALGDDANPLVRILGALAGGLAGGAGGSMALLNTKDLAREAMRDVRPQDLKRALIETELAKAQGVNTLPQQHMPRESNLDTFVSTLAGNRAGVKTTEMLRNQPQQVDLLQEKFLQEVPGALRDKHVVADNAQDAATQVLKNLKAERSQGWKDTFAAVADDLGTTGELAASTVKRVQNFFNKTAKDIGETSQAAEWLTSLGNKLSTTKTVEGFKQVLVDTGLLDASGNPVKKAVMQAAMEKRQIPLQDVEQLNTLFKEATDGLKTINLGTSGVQSGSTKFLGGKVQQARELIGEENLPFKEADAWYKEFTENVYNAVKKGVIGRVAGRTGSSADVEAPVQRLFKVFDEGTLPGATSSSITKLGRKFRELTLDKDGIEGKEVFNEAVKRWFADGIDKANKVDPTKSAEAMVKYFGDITRTNSQTQGLRDMLSEVAKNQGMNATDTAAYIKGIENMSKIFKAASKRPQVSGISSEAIEDTASQGLGRRLGQVSIMTPLRQPMLAWSALVGHKSLKAIDNLITSPEGMRKLVELGKQTPMSQASVNTLTTLLEAAANVGEIPAEKTRKAALK